MALSLQNNLNLNVESSQDDDGEGALVGSDVDGTGLRITSCVGDWVGFRDGAFVGSDVPGAILIDPFVGLFVGSSVGDTVGDTVGATVGDEDIALFPKTLPKSSTESRYDIPSNSDLHAEPPDRSQDSRSCLGK